MSDHELSETHYVRGYRDALTFVETALTAAHKPAGGPAPAALGGAVEPREVVVTAPPAGLDLAILREVSARRRDRWHTPDTIPWTGADWGNAMGGECGEAQNVVKKLRRIETGTGSQNDPDRDVLVEMLGDELADTIAYADLLADHYGIDLSDAIARKFNAISEREGFPERLPRRVPEGGGRVAEESETHRVSPAPQGDAGSRERLDPLAATTLDRVRVVALAWIHQEPDGCEDTAQQIKDGHTMLRLLDGGA